MQVRTPYLLLLIALLGLPGSLVAQNQDQPVTERARQVVIDMSRELESIIEGVERHELDDEALASRIDGTFDRFITFLLDLMDEDTFMTSTDVMRDVSSDPDVLAARQATNNALQRLMESDPDAGMLIRELMEQNAIRMLQTLVEEGTAKGLNREYEFESSDDSEMGEFMEESEADEFEYPQTIVMQSPSSSSYDASLPFAVPESSDEEGDLVASVDDYYSSYSLLYAPLQEMRTSVDSIINAITSVEEISHSRTAILKVVDRFFDQVKAKGNGTSDFLDSYMFESGPFSLFSVEYGTNETVGSAIRMMLEDVERHITMRLDSLFGYDWGTE